jgi:hypothetical protein
MASIAAARAAQDSLRQKLQGQPWFRGIGITALKCMCSDPYELQVNVDTRASYDQLQSCAVVPKQWMGVPITFAIAGDAAALGAAQTLTTQDYANVALGAITAAGTFMLGKIAVGAILESRKEHFERKGQPVAAVKAKETTFDGVMKLAATAFSIWQISQQLPEIITEAKKYLPP